MASSTPNLADGVLVSGSNSLAADSDEWFEWLEIPENNSFYFRDSTTNFTARKEKRRGGWYWYAYRRYQGKLYSAYIGKSTELTQNRLAEVGRTLLKGDSTEIAPSAPPVVEIPPLPNPTDPPPNLLQNDVLLATKLYIPPLRSKVVPRSRLTTKLDSIYEQNRQCRLLLITAPAGFGKTTLLSQWLIDSKLPTAWLSIEENDDDPVRFWNYGVAALNTLFKELNLPERLPLYTNQTTSVEHLLINAINKLSTVQRDYALVLDDYHFIENENIKKGVIFLLEHQPKNMHLVILSRTTPTLPLAKLKVRNELVEITANDLRFTPNEAMAFLNEVMGLQLSEEIIEKLETRTEGWAAGLQLAALSLQGRNARNIATFIDSLIGTPQFVLDYLGEEVLAQQPPEIQTFLLQTSILEELHISLCQAVTGRADSQNLLEQLERNNIFLTSVDESRQCYRYHVLFAEFLQSYLRRTFPPDQINLLYSRASLWYEQNNRITEAINHAAAGQDFERAAGLIEKHADGLLRRGAEATLAKWMEILPDAVISQRPQLCVFHAWALVNFGNLEAVEVRLEQAEATLQAEVTQPDYARRIRGEIVAIRSSVTNSLRDIPATITYSEQALKMLPLDHHVRGTVGLNLGLAYYLGGNIEAAKKVFAEAMNIGKATKDSNVVLIAATYLAVLQVRQGNLRAGYNLYRQNLQLTTDANGQSLAGADGVHMNLGMLLYEWNDLAEAEAQFVKGIEISEEWKSIEMLIEGYIMLSRLRQAQNRIDEALQIWEKIEKITNDYNIDWFTNYTRARRARFDIVVGNLEMAVWWSEQANLQLDAEAIAFNKRAVEYIILASLRMAQKNWAEADFLLTRLLEVARSGGYRSREIWILALQALLYEGQGQSRLALATLHYALQLAESEGYIRVFADEGYRMTLLFSKYLTEYPEAAKLSPTYTSKLAKALSLEQLALEQRQLKQFLDPQESLTRREHTILHMLAENKSNQRIAQELTLTVNTVRSHINSIKNKLGVHNRYEVLAEARKRHLL